MPDSLEEKSLDQGSAVVNQPTTDTNNSEDTIKVLLKTIESLKSELKADFQKGLNSLDKKFSKPKPQIIEDSDSEIDETPVEKPITKDKKALTVETLKAESEQKLKQLEDGYKSEIEKLRSEQKERETAVFQANLKSKIVTILSKNGFEDADEVLDYFLHKHEINNFISGSDGYYIYKKDEEDKGKTLEKLVTDWKETKTGKRFIAADKLPNGAGIKETNKPVKDQIQPSASKTDEILKKISAGEMKFSQF